MALDHGHLIYSIQGLWKILLTFFTLLNVHNSLSKMLRMGYLSEFRTFQVLETYYDMSTIVFVKTPLPVESETEFHNPTH